MKDDLHFADGVNGQGTENDKLLRKPGAVPPDKTTDTTFFEMSDEQTDIAWELKVRSRRNRKQRLRGTRSSSQEPPPSKPLPTPSEPKDGSGCELPEAG